MSESQSAHTIIPKHIPELDGIRGLAILLVIFYHYIAVPIPGNANKYLLFLQKILSNGWSGVDLFFVLSGFLITGILLDNRDAKNYFKVFYLRRINRIFPLYYFFLFLFLFLQRYAHQWGIFSSDLFTNVFPIFPYFMYLQNFTMAANGGFGNEFLAMTWSLSIEEQFYLFLPWLVRRSRHQRLPLNILFLISLPLILRLTLGGDGHFHVFVLTPWRLDPLFLGSLLAVIVRTPKAFDFLKTHQIWIKSVFYLLLLLILYSSLTEELGSLDHLFTFGVFYTILVFVPLADNTHFLAQFFRHPALKKISLISYGMYMFHQLINGILHDLVFKQPPIFHDFPTFLITLLAFALTYIFASGTYFAFEKRFIAFGHKQHYEGE